MAKAKFGLKRIYIALLLLRIISAYSGMGYIHPDEYFQNPEVMAGPVLNLHNHYTWEWSPLRPVRSVLPPFLTTGIPFFLANLSWLGQPIPPRTVFFLTRSSFLVFSFILDLSLVHLIPVSRNRQLALVLLSSSHVVNTFQLRAFSNSTEALLVAGALVAFKEVAEAALQPHPDKIPGETGGASKAACVSDKLALPLHVLAVITPLGIFTRPTYAFFLLPIIIQTIRLLFSIAPHCPSSDSNATPTSDSAGPSPPQTESSTSRFTALVKPFQPLFRPLLTAIATTLLTVTVDSIWFRSPTLTPLNFLLYNLSAKNLAEHGVHPRWLHVAVNAPLILTPGLLWYALKASAKVLTARIGIDTERNDGASRVRETEPTNSTAILNKTLVYVILTSMALLSTQPHQEPRFIVPLLVPVIVLVSNIGEVPSLGRAFWATWCLSNVLLTLLFGVFHQGGVVLSLFKINSLLERAFTDSTSLGQVRVIYWNTYMPPRHLLGVSQADADSNKVTLVDLSGISPFAFMTNLEDSLPRSQDGVKFLVTPPWAVNQLFSFYAEEADLPAAGRLLDRECVSLRKEVYPHLDLDHLAESWEEGWPKGLALGVYELDSSCFLENRRNGRTATSNLNGID